GDRRLVDKTPSYTLSPPVLERAEAEFEEPLYLHLVRHPYGMIASFEEAKLDQIFFRYEHPFSRRELAELIWLVSQRNILDFLRRVPAGRQLQVRFEDLVREPAAVMERVCAFLGIDLHPDMVLPYKNERARMTDGLHAESRMLGDVKFHQHKGVEASAAERWRETYGEDFLGGATWDMAARLGYDVEKEAIGRNGEAGEPLPLSFAQERLWFLDQLDPGTRTYNVSTAVRLLGRLDAPALGGSLNEIARRHASLRTTFTSAQGSPAQAVAPELRLAMPVVDLSGLPEPLREGEARAVLTRHAGEPFDLTRGALLRALLLRLGAEDHAASFVAHHIVCDGWSIGVLVRELAALYTAAVEGKASPLPELRVQYVDFAAWQRRWLAGSVLEDQLAYWRERLDRVPVLQLPADRPRPGVQSFEGSTHGFTLPAGLSEALRTLSRERGVTVFMAVLAAFQALLARLSGQRDFAVGSPVAGRNRRDLEPLIGFFVNTLVFRASLSGDPGYGELLDRTRQVALGAYAHQDVPFEKVVQELAPERNLSYTPLFQVMLAFQNAPAGRLDLPGLTLAPMVEDFTTSKFDISLTVFDQGPEIFGQWVYSVALFDGETIARWAGNLHTLLEGLLAEPERPLSELSLLTQEERRQILVDWNRPPADYPDEGFVHRLFEEQAARRPEAVAAAFEGETLTYGELNARANRLAHRLRRLGVGPDVLVGVRAGRSFEMIAGLLAILKAGGAYLPLDPALPEERLRFMIEDAGISPGLGLVLDEDRLREDVSPESAENPEAVLHPDHLAYVIYTSGSTGQPKGVMISHRALGNRLQYARAGDVTADDAFLQKTTISFDVSVLEIFGPLIAGGTGIMVRAGGQGDTAYLLRLIAEEGITHATFPPSVLSV
ncbi:MAG: condensation domain-containing protein, partial [Thermoanaerobaculia bacterium]